MLPQADHHSSYTYTNQQNLKENLCYLHQSRQAFIESENSEQIRRALNHNIRTYSDTCKAKMDNKSWSNMVQTMSDYTHAISPLIVIQ